MDLDDKNKDKIALAPIEPKMKKYDTSVEDSE
jgi:hypothetical protein